MGFTSLLGQVVEILKEEASRYEIFIDRYTKPKKKKNGKVIPPKVPLDVMRAIMLADPTSKAAEDTDIDDGTIEKVGSYTQWIIKQFLGLQQQADEAFPYGTPQWKEEIERLKTLFLEDLYKVTEDLAKFDRFKSRIEENKRDINQVKSIDELYELTKDFSMEEEVVTKSEEKERRKREDVEYMYDGDKYEVVAPMTKEVSCDMAGAPLTRWCTASSGWNYYDTYSKQGPLYIIRDKTDIVQEGRGAGEPRPVYQFHFPSNQFMDQDDRSINLENWLQGEGVELKEFFKHEFAKSLNKDFGDKVQINYPNDAVSRFIALYGFDEFFEKLPKSLVRFDFEKGNRSGYGNDKKEEVPSMPLHPQILDFPNLQVLHVEGILSSMPEEIGDRLKNLQFISVPNNPDLTALPSSLANLPNLEVLNIRNSPKVQIPQELQDKVDKGEIVLVS